MTKISMIEGWPPHGVWGLKDLPTAAWANEWASFWTDDSARILRRVLQNRGQWPVVSISMKSWLLDYDTAGCPKYKP